MRHGRKSKTKRFNGYKEHVATDIDTNLILACAVTHLQSKLRLLQGTGAGRERLRERTTVEHSLAHIAARKGPKARYRSRRKNEFDLRRAAAIQNLETVHRIQHPARLRRAA